MFLYIFSHHPIILEQKHFLHLPHIPLQDHLSPVKMLSSEQPIPRYSNM